ncbi:MAG: hypothetical protein ACYSTN_06685 [Planctomycetota bacterium]
MTKPKTSHSVSVEGEGVISVRFAKQEGVTDLGGDGDEKDAYCCDCNVAYGLWSGDRTI